VLVGAFGTLIGAGGGFVLVPVLLILYPEDSPALVTGISLAVVFFNAASGSAVMTVGAAYLFFRPKGPATPAVRRHAGRFQRTLVERDGITHTWSYDPFLGVGISVVVGFASSLLGIGGGIIHVPVLAQLLDFPVHIATATSHFTLAIMALVGTLVHLAKGELQPGLGRIAALAVGVVAGAQVGAALSQRVGAVWIMRGLAVALGLVGVRILAGSL
jgi:hypothetical protein